MTDQKPTSKKQQNALARAWEHQQHWYGRGDEDAQCLLDLRARVEALEAADDLRRVDILRLTNAVANQVPDRIKLFTDVMPDSDSEVLPPGAPERSLVHQVRAAIGEQYENFFNDDGIGEACAAIREVAEWVRKQDPDNSMIHWLEMEIGDWRDRR